MREDAGARRPANRAPRRKPVLPRRGVPTTPRTPAGAIEVLNVRVRTSGQGDGDGEDAHDWVHRAPRAVGPASDGDGDGDDDNPGAVSMRGFRGFGYGTDGLGIVPGASSAAGGAGAMGGAQEVLHLTEETAEKVWDVLANCRDDDASEAPSTTKSDVEIARERLAAANLAAPIVKGEAAGLAPTSGGRRRAASSVNILDELSAQERHGAVVASRAAASVDAREEAERVLRARKLRDSLLRRRVLEKGFAEMRVDEALAANPEVGDTKKHALERLSAVLDWLCLRVPKDEMPDAFVRLSEASQKQKESKTELVVSGAATTHEAHVSDTRATDPYVLLLQRAMLARLMAIGFSRAESREMLESCGWIEEDAMYALLKSLQPADSDTPLMPPSQNNDDMLAERGEEAMALEAILDDKFKICEADKLWTVQVELDEDAAGRQWDTCALEVHFPPGSTYPAEAPLFVVRHDALPATVRRSVAASVAAHAHAYLGEPCVYAVIDWVRENMPTILAERGTLDDGAEEGEEGDGFNIDDDVREDTFVLTGRGAHIKRTYERLEAEQAKRDADEDERRERIEYFRAMMAEERARADVDDPPPPQHVSDNNQVLDVSREDTSLESKLSRWEQEHAKRLASTAAAVAKPKKKVVPNVRKNDSKTTTGKAPNWLAKQVQKAGLDRHAGDETRDETQEIDALAAAAANALSGATPIEDDVHSAERRASVSARLLELETAKVQSDKWREMQKVRAKLPAADMKAVVLDAIESSRAAVVSGATGCGKTTQVPQFIFEEAVKAGKGGETSIIITQPRRLSAIAVAERVADERCERIGDVVGYSIRLESKQSQKTRMLFCTTGILLRRLQTDPNLTGVSHVVVDEVHERDLLSDFLLVILRSLAAKRKDFHLVAMSATVNADLFKNYFESHIQAPCPVVEIPGRTFPVSEYRLEDAIEATGYVCEPDGEFALGVEQSGRGGRVFKMLGGGGARGAALREAVEESFDRSAMSDVRQETRDMYPEYSETTWKSLQVIDEEKINYELIELLVAYIADDLEDGAVLIFLPGMAEIRTLHDRLRANLHDADARFLLVPLHSTLSSDEQRMTFSKPPPGVRKIVMATNIAETSITIDDVVFVIDSGRVRETQYDPASRMSALVTAWCSKASSRQRRGRAGRVREGYCFHLYSSKTEATVLADFTTPEILRTPLDALCLQIKILGLGDIRQFLSMAIEPPPEDAIASALKSLYELDAVDSKDELTALGHHLAELPVDARLGKMMLYGAMFSCLDPILTIAAGVGFRSPFMAPMDKRDEADAAKRKIASQSSDHLTLVRAYAGWLYAKSKGRGFERDYLSKLFLSGQTLKQISEMRQQYTELLDQIGFLRSGAGTLGIVPHSTEQLPQYRSGRGRRNRLEQALAEASVNAGNEALVRAVICAGLYPNVAVLSAVQQSADDQGGRSRYTSNANKATVQTKHDKDVHLHPTSVCYGAPNFDARFLLYHEKVRTTKVYIRDATAVGSYPLLLFGGKIKINHERSSAVCDGWIHFRAAPRVAVLFKHLRAELDALLMEKIASPAMDISHRVDVVRAIVEVLDSESAATLERSALASSPAP